EATYGRAPARRLFACVPVRRRARRRADRYRGRPAGYRHRAGAGRQRSPVARALSRIRRARGRDPAGAPGAGAYRRAVGHPRRAGGQPLQLRAGGAHLHPRLRRAGAVRRARRAGAGGRDSRHAAGRADHAEPRGSLAAGPRRGHPRPRVGAVRQRVRRSDPLHQRPAPRRAVRDGAPRAGRWRRAAARRDERGWPHGRAGVPRLGLAPALRRLPRALPGAQHAGGRQRVDGPRGERGAAHLEPGELRRTQPRLPVRLPAARGPAAGVRAQRAAGHGRGRAAGAAGGVVAPGAGPRRGGAVGVRADEVHRQPHPHQRHRPGPQRPGRARGVERRRGAASVDGGRRDGGAARPAPQLCQRGGTAGRPEAGPAGARHLVQRVRPGDHDAARAGGRAGRHPLRPLPLRGERPPGLRHQPGRLRRADDAPGEPGPRRVGGGHAIRHRVRKPGDRVRDAHDHGAGQPAQRRGRLQPRAEPAAHGLHGSGRQGPRGAGGVGGGGRLSRPDRGRADPVRGAGGAGPHLLSQRGPGEPPRLRGRRRADAPRGMDGARGLHPYRRALRPLRRGRGRPRRQPRSRHRAAPVGAVAARLSPARPVRRRGRALRVVHTGGGYRRRRAVRIARVRLGGRARRMGARPRRGGGVLPLRRCDEPAESGLQHVRGRQRLRRPVLRAGAGPLAVRGPADAAGRSPL
ncbi:MAG: TonB-dependent receptor, partial [uncultured Gemmatimonadetes bacterium]